MDLLTDIWNWPIDNIEGRWEGILDCRMGNYLIIG